MRTNSEEIVVNNIKIIRRNIKVSQETIARKACIAISAYRRIENWQAQPSGLFLLNIAKALNEKPEKVFFIIKKFDLERYKKQYKITDYKK